jgi:hypothetical protein
MRAAEQIQLASLRHLLYSFVADVSFVPGKLITANEYMQELPQSVGRMVESRYQLRQLTQ